MEIEKLKGNSYDQSHTPVPHIPCEKSVDQQVKSSNEHVRPSPSDNGDPSDQVTSNVSSYPTCAAETGLLEDTPEPFPLADNSLGVNKPIAFDISLSATPADKSRKKISTKKLKM